YSAGRTRPFVHVERRPGLRGVDDDALDLARVGVDVGVGVQRDVEHVLPQQRLDLGQLHPGRLAVGAGDDLVPELVDLFVGVTVRVLVAVTDVQGLARGDVARTGPAEHRRVVRTGLAGQPLAPVRRGEVGDLEAGLVALALHQRRELVAHRVVGVHQRDLDR